jgi:outer membrane lipoprotein carrier protein
MTRLQRLAMRWSAVLPAVAALLWLSPVQAAGVTALDGYLEGLSTWSAEFTQEVRDEDGEQVESGSGRLIIVRPGRFRWESRPEDSREVAQVMIADGRNLWFYDIDLEQVTVKSQQEELPRSPAMLLAGGAGLREAFDVVADGRRDGQDWVRVRPRDAESDFSEALFGFKGRELARLVMFNKLGQRSTLTFRAVRRNAAIDPKLTQFEVPKGADLIGTPVQP